MRCSDGDGLSAEERARREQIRLVAAAAEDWNVDVEAGDRGMIAADADRLSRGQFHEGGLLAVPGESYNRTLSGLLADDINSPASKVGNHERILVITQRH
jgi:hypothetical protein